MKYFIDFEAQKYTNEIISIGCIREDGKKFYSLVHPGNKHRKLSNFIKELTHITQEEIDNAPSVDMVFSQFFTWIMYDKEPVQFYCYGNCDIQFVRSSMKLATNIFAQTALSLIASNLHDYSNTVVEHFNLYTPPSLMKVVSYFAKREIAQTHNALDDAGLLYYIYLNIQKNLPIESDAFSEHKKHITDMRLLNESSYAYVIRRYKDKKCVNTFLTLEAAADHIDMLMFKENPKGSRPNKDNIKKRITAAIKLNKPYYHNCYWKIEKAKKGNN